MDLNRISLKLFLADPRAAKLEEIVPLFHGWIQKGTVPGLLIDVADYKHVQDGPGVVLIGHEADQALDLSGGRPGFLYRRKRALEGTLKERLRTVFRGALLGARALETDPASGGRLRFRTDEAELSFLDRLLVPAGPDGLELVKADVRALAEGLYAGSKVNVTPANGDARECLRLTIGAPGAPSLETLLQRLEVRAGR